MNVTAWVTYSEQPVPPDARFQGVLQEHGKQLHIQEATLEQVLTRCVSGVYSGWLVNEEGGARLEVQIVRSQVQAVRWEQLLER